jgi:hypothetical protein
VEDDHDLGQDVSEFLDTLGLVKPYLTSFLRRKIKKNEIFFLCSDAPEDQAICLFAGLFANPDMSLSRTQEKHPQREK